MTTKAVAFWPTSSGRAQILNYSASVLFLGTMFGALLGSILVWSGTFGPRDVGNFSNAVFPLGSFLFGYLASKATRVPNAPVPSENSELEKGKMLVASTVSHELRTPLTSIKGALRLIENCVPNGNKDLESLLTIANRNTNRMLEILSEILDLQKLETVRLDMDNAPVELGMLVRNSLELNEGYASEYQVQLQFDTEVDGALVIGCEAKLQQALTNILSNAVKFSPTRAKVIVNLSESGQNWRISVKDQGPGISKTDQGSLFNRFAKIHPADGVSRSGSGLGLAICKAIVRAHDGTIVVESTIGVGTTFSILLPQIKQLDDTIMTAGNHRRNLGGDECSLFNVGRWQ